MTIPALRPFDKLRTGRLRTNGILECRGNDKDRFLAPLEMTGQVGWRSCGRIVKSHYRGALPPGAPAEVYRPEHGEHHERTRKYHEERPVAGGFSVSQALGFVPYPRQVSQHVCVAVPPRVVGAHVECAFIGFQVREEEHVEIFPLYRRYVEVKTRGPVLGEPARYVDRGEPRARQEPRRRLAVARFDEPVVVEPLEYVPRLDHERVTRELVRIG